MQKIIYFIHRKHVNCRKHLIKQTFRRNNKMIAVLNRIQWLVEENVISLIINCIIALKFQKNQKNRRIPNVGCFFKILFAVVTYSLRTSRIFIRKVNQLHFESFFIKKYYFYGYQRPYGKCMVMLKNAAVKNKCNKRPEVSLKLSCTTSVFLEMLFYLVKDYNGNFLTKQRRNCTLAVFLLFSNAVYEFR